MVASLPVAMVKNILVLWSLGFVNIYRSYHLFKVLPVVNSVLVIWWSKIFREEIENATKPGFLQANNKIVYVDTTRSRWIVVVSGSPVPTQY